MPRPCLRKGGGILMVFQATDEAIFFLRFVHTCNCPEFLREGGAEPQYQAIA